MILRTPEVMHLGPVTPPTERHLENARRTITRRLLPFLCLLYLIAYLDRVNISFAGLEMTRELNLSPEQYGFGAGIFFIGYILLEIPGAILVETWSARLWIARIMVSWGLVSSATGLIQNSSQFYLMRFLLGVAEAGFYPGMVVYLSHWYRRRDRARAVALFMTAIPLSEVLGAPISGLLMQIRWLDWSGWRWLLILEGLPAIVLGVVTALVLPDRPRHARWLRAEERDALEDALAEEKRLSASDEKASVWRTITQPPVLILAAAYFLILNVNTAHLMWLPKFLQHASGATTVMLGFMAAIPWIADLPVAVGNAWHSDKTGERRWHVAVPMFVGALALALTIPVQNYTALMLLTLSIATMSLHAYRGPFWALPGTILSGRAAAAAVGFISCFGNLGAFLGPWLVGILRKQSTDFGWGIAYMSISAALTGFLVLLLRSQARQVPSREVRQEAASHAPTS
jgi:MFS transporter, ACS family, tartrate transporter